MKDDTRVDWHRRVDLAVIRLLGSIDDAPDFRETAEDLAASPWHFHRKFRELTGETFHDCAFRLRLEKAMYLLRTTSYSITRIAIECGYSAPERLSKAVRAAYGLNSRQLRGKADWHPSLPSRAGIHYSPEPVEKHWFYIEGGDEMKTKIIAFDEKIFYGYGCRGDYWQLPEVWGRFIKMTEERKLSGKEYLSLFPDSAETIPMKDKRAFAGFVSTVPIEDSVDFERIVIPSGLYAVTVHYGSTETIGPVWQQWKNEWMPSCGWEADSTRPNYEWYQNKPENPELQLTFLVTSVKRREF